MSLIQLCPTVGEKCVYSSQNTFSDASGAGDGSVRVWEWGVGQPLATPRPAGRFAKVNAVRFASAGGNKLAMCDGDGTLALWHTGSGGVAPSALSRPFYVRFFLSKNHLNVALQNAISHNKSASDVTFLGDCCSLLATAGYGSADANIALWDVLLPPKKALIHCKTLLS